MVDRAARSASFVVVVGVGLAVLLGLLWLPAGDGPVPLAPGGVGTQFHELRAAGATVGDPPRDSPAAPRSERTALGASILGRTSRRDGTVLANIAVRASSGAATQSGGDGRFALRGLPRGRCSLSAEAEGCVSVPSGTIVLTETDSIEGVDLVLDRACFVTGRIGTTAGAPLSGAHVSGRLRTVEVWPDLPEEALREAPKLATRTDAEGRFRLGPFAPGRVELTVEHDTHLPFARLYPSDASNVQIAFEVMSSVSGVVLDPDGRSPAVLERVLLLVANQSRGGWSVAAEVAPDPADAAAGRFHLPVPVPREVRVVPVTRDFAPARSAAFRVLPGKAQGPLELRASAGARIAGRIRDSAGAAVAGAEIRVREDGAAFDVARVTAGADGAFVLALAPGCYAARIRKPGYAPGHVPIEIVAGLAAPAIAWELARGAALAGRIQDAEGATLPALEVLAVHGTDLHVAAESALVRDGSFQFDYLPPGKYRMTARERGDSTIPDTGEVVGLAAGQSASIDLVPTALGLCRIRGIVTRDGMPQPFVTVQLARARESALATATADRFGRFEFACLAPGALALTVTHGARGPELARQGLVLRAGEDHETVIAIACGSLAGRVVVTSTRVPLAEIRIDVFATDGRVLATTRTNQNGQFELPRVAAGEWTLGLSRPGEGTCKQLTVRVAASQARRLAEVEL